MKRNRTSNLSKWSGGILQDNSDACLGLCKKEPCTGVRLMIILNIESFGHNGIGNKIGQCSINNEHKNTCVTPIVPFYYFLRLFFYKHSTPKCANTIYFDLKIKNTEHIKMNRTDIYVLICFYC